MKTTFSIFFGIVGTLFSSNILAQISESQAIIFAERFIKANGYTDEAIDTFKYKLSYTLNDELYLQSGKYTVDSIVKHRYNTLYVNAYCVTHNDNSKQWNIGFISTSIPLAKLDSINSSTDLEGQCVIVSDSGDEIRIVHKKPLFSKFRKL